MKILLIAPVISGERRPGSMDIPQLTLSLLAGMTPEKHEVVICEEVYGDVINYDGDYDVVGITIMTQTAIRGYEIANEFQLRNVTVVFGGIHATVHPQEALMFGNAVVIGEAEGLWETILEDIENKRLQPVYRHTVFPDLQKHYYPRRDLIRCHSGKFAVAPIETTRGCPYNCDFCSVSRFFGTKQRHKPVRDIIEEAESCPEKYLFFLDDNITGDKRYAESLFNELKALKKVWVGQASVNLTKDPALMKKAKDSGCTALLIGFESMTEQGSHTYRKTLKTIQENVDAVRKLQDNGILTMASLIFGLDSDTEDVFDLGHEFLTRSKSAFFQACITTPYPGTPVFEKMKSEGRILTDNWSKFDATKVLISPKNMTPERLLAGANEIQRRIYSNNSILKRSLPNAMIGITQAILYFSLNKGYQKRHKIKKQIGIQYNAEGMAVDFDVTKYVKPAKLFSCT